MAHHPKTISNCFRPREPAYRAWRWREAGNGVGGLDYRPVRPLRGCGAMLSGRPTLQITLDRDTGLTALVGGCGRIVGRCGSGGGSSLVFEIGMAQHLTHPRPARPVKRGGNSGSEQQTMNLWSFIPISIGFYVSTPHQTTIPIDFPPTRRTPLSGKRGSLFP